MKAFEVLINVLVVVIDDKAKKFKIYVPFHFQVGKDFGFKVETFTNGVDLSFVEVG